jgi:hypothetical protein
MLVAFWDSRGMILIHFMPKGQTVTAKFYSEVILKNLREKLKQMRPRLVQKNVLLLHDNAPPIPLQLQWRLSTLTNGNCFLTLLIAHTSCPTGLRHGSQRNTKALTKMAKVRRRRWRIFWKRVERCFLKCWMVFENESKVRNIFWLPLV